MKQDRQLVRLLWGTASAFLLGSTPASAESLGDRLRELPREVWHSSRAQKALTECILLTSRYAPVIVDGEHGYTVAWFSAPFTMSHALTIKEDPAAAGFLVELRGPFKARGLVKENDIYADLRGCL